MTSSIVKRSIVIGGHKTSVSLEDAFWRGLKEIAHGQRVTLSNMVSEIDRARQQSNLSSAIRLFVLDRMRVRAAIDAGSPINRTNGAEADVSGHGNIETRV